MLDPLPLPPEKQPFALNHRPPIPSGSAAGPADLSDRLRTAVQSLPEVDLFGPNWPRHRYVAASTRHTIFAFAIGTDTLAFRLDPRFHPRALAAGAIAYNECGDDWVSFSVGPDTWPRTDFDLWATLAYHYARAIGE